MKIKSILVSMLAVAALASCSKDNTTGNGGPQADPDGTAYMSLKVVVPTSQKTRNSDEVDAEPNEMYINSLYVITFDDSKALVHHRKETPVISVSGTSGVIRVSPEAKYLLAIANPSANLLARLNDAIEGTPWSVLNQEIMVSGSVSNEGLVDDLISNGFMMINMGATPNDGVTKYTVEGLFDITDYIKTVDGIAYQNEEEARAAADGDRAVIGIERLTSKIIVNDIEQIDSSPTRQQGVVGGSFEFLGWTLDCYNSKYFPFALKRNTPASHTSSFYTNNFYTEDPNFVDTGAVPHDGIRYNNPTAMVTGGGNWFLPREATYCIENTMDAAAQLHQNATRVVIRGRYYPEAGWTDSWFSFASVNYPDLAAVQAAYTQAEDLSLTNLVNACDQFASLLGLGGFLTITQSDLDNLPVDATELIRAANVLKWYRDGVNYYTYAIRHDNTITDYMAFGKYGVVRNNFYQLTLTKVNGAGTPWYPDPVNPGPGEPDPTDPLDERVSVLGFEINVAPWVRWETGFEI